MKVTQFLSDGGASTIERLAPIIESLNSQREVMARLPSRALLDLMDDFSSRLLRDPSVRDLDGVAFLASWLRRANLEKVLRINLGGAIRGLDGFADVGGARLAARPRGLVAMWMAGNVPTLPMFSLVPALLTKNVCLVKLAHRDPEGMDTLLKVLAGASADNVSGEELLKSVAVVWFDYTHHELNEEMSMAADTRIAWGGAEAIRAITALPRQEHCTDIVFGPKYSIGLIDRRRLESGSGLDDVVAGFVRDIVAFDQRACSAPQTIFMERNSALSLRAVGERFAREMARLPPKPGLDAYTTIRILNARAQWAMDEERDVIASGAEANWTVCMDRQVSIKEAVQSRTIFLTEVESWRQILPLLNPRIQTVGVSFGRDEDVEVFALEATLRGVARCVRPGLMNLYESPWDGKLVMSELVRWVTLKP